MDLEELLKDLAKSFVGEPRLSDEELRAEFRQVCQRADSDPAEQRRISDLADRLDAEERLYAEAVAAADRGDTRAALPLLRQCAEADIGEAAWRLAQLLEDTGDFTEAAAWYERACDDGEIRAIDRLVNLRSLQHTADAEAVPPDTPATMRERNPAMIRNRKHDETADDAISVARVLGAPDLDLRVISDDDRAYSAAMVAELRNSLDRSPGGAFGLEVSAAVLRRAAMAAQHLIANRDERGAMRLLLAAAAHAKFLGRMHPAVLEVRRAHADACCELGRPALAERLLRQLGEDERQVFGSDNPQTALILAWTLIETGQLRAAESGFRDLGTRLGQADTRTGGRTAPELPSHLRCRASWLQIQLGHTAEGVKLYDTVIAQRSAELGYDHADTLDTSHSKGKGLVVSGHGAEALTLLEALADNRARVQGDRHPDTLETLKFWSLARVQAEPQNPGTLDSAIETLGEIHRLQNSMQSPGHPMSRDTAAWLGKLRRQREAVRFHEPVLVGSPRLVKGQ